MTAVTHRHPRRGRSRQHSQRGSRSGLAARSSTIFAGGGDLEATGRSGSDDGFDTRALEIVEPQKAYSEHDRIR